MHSIDRNNNYIHRVSEYSGKSEGKMQSVLNNCEYVLWTQTLWKPSCDAWNDSQGVPQEESGHSGPPALLSAQSGLVIAEWTGADNPI